MGLGETFGGRRGGLGFRRLDDLGPEVEAPVRFPDQG